MTDHGIKVIADHYGKKHQTIKTMEELAELIVWECPSCGFEWSARAIDYCYKCGQRLDWGNEDAYGRR